MSGAGDEKKEEGPEISGPSYIDATSLVSAALPESALPPLSAVHEGPPPARVWPAKFPDAANRLASCRERVQALAAELMLPQENLVDPEVVRQLTWEPIDAPSEQAVAERMRAAGAREWQIELTAPVLAEALHNLP